MSWTGSFGGCESLDVLQLKQIEVFIVLQSLFPGRRVYQPGGNSVTAASDSDARARRTWKTINCSRQLTV